MCAWSRISPLTRQVNRHGERVLQHNSLSLRALLLQPGLTKHSAIVVDLDSNPNVDRGHQAKSPRPKEEHRL